MLYAIVNQKNIVVGTIKLPDNCAVVVHRFGDNIIGGPEVNEISRVIKEIVMRHEPYRLVPLTHMGNPIDIIEKPLS